MEELTLQEFWNQHSEWSQATFGTDVERGPIGALKHLAKEVAEAQTSIGSSKHLEELADCLFLLCDATRRSGFTCRELLHAAFLKLEKNKKRTWVKPQFPDEPIEHLRGVHD